MIQNPCNLEETDLVPRCPECEQRARGTLEEVQGIALVVADPDSGKPVYVGETVIDWDSQQTVNREGKPLWVCPSGHDWPADAIPE